MASRKRLYTSKTLRVIDKADVNIPKALGIISIVKESIKMGVFETELSEDYENAIMAAEGLLHEVVIACYELSKEEAIYADTLEEYLAEEKAEFEMRSTEIADVN